MEICPVTRMRIEQVMWMTTTSGNVISLAGGRGAVSWLRKSLLWRCRFCGAVNCGRGVCGPQYYH